VDIFKSQQIFTLVPDYAMDSSVCFFVAVRQVFEDRCLVNVKRRPIQKTYQNNIFI